MLDGAEILIERPLGAEGQEEEEDAEIMKTDSRALAIHHTHSLSLSLSHTLSLSYTPTHGPDKNGANDCCSVEKRSVKGRDIGMKHEVEI